MYWELIQLAYLLLPCAKSILFLKTRQAESLPHWIQVFGECVNNDSEEANIEQGSVNRWV